MWLTLAVLEAAGRSRTPSKVRLGCLDAGLASPQRESRPRSLIVQWAIIHISVLVSSKFEQKAVDFLLLGDHRISSSAQKI